MTDFRCSIYGSDYLRVDDKTDDEEFVEVAIASRYGMPVYLSRSQQLALRDHMNTLLGEDEEPKPSASDLIGKKVKIGYNHPGGRGGYVNLNEVTSVEIVEDPIPEEPLGAHHVKILDTMYTRSPQGLWSPSDGRGAIVRDWKSLVLAARAVRASINVVYQTAEELR